MTTSCGCSVARANAGECGCITCATERARQSMPTWGSPRMATSLGQAVGEATKWNSEPAKNAAAPRGRRRCAQAAGVGPAVSGMMVDAGGSGPLLKETVSVTGPSLMRAVRLSSAVSKYAEQVERAVTSAAASRGYDLSDLTVDEVVAVDGLADALLAAAKTALRLEGITPAVEFSFRGASVKGSAAGAMAAGASAGPSRRARPMALGRTKMGIPVYPIGWTGGGGTDGLPWFDCSDVDQFQEARGSEWSLQTCSTSMTDAVASARARLVEKLDSVPSSVEGVRYRDLVEEYLSIWDRTNCFTENEAARHCWTHLYGGFGYDRSTDAPHTLSFGNPFALPGFASIIDPVDFQAGVLVHELVHMIDSSSNENVAVGSCTSCSADCDRNDERRAAFVQARFMGIDDCGAKMFACAYARGFSLTADPTENGFLTIAEFLQCYTGGASVLDVTAFLALALLDSSAFAAVFGDTGISFSLSALMLAFLFDAWLE